MMTSRPASNLLLGTAAVLMATASSVALAQKPDAWPSRPIRLIVPFPPGGGTDLVGRSVGNKLDPALGQRIVIDNRGGAGGTIGAELAARSDPDGYTMFIGNIGAIAINPTLYAGKLSYDPQRDLAPVTLSSDALNILMVHPTLPVRSVKELIALAISVSKQCDGCIASHARVAARRGATAAEVAEALGVAIVLNGGPGTVHAPRAFAAFEEFASKQQ